MNTAKRFRTSLAKVTHFLSMRVKSAERIVYRVADAFANSANPQGATPHYVPTRDNLADQWEVGLEPGDVADAATQAIESGRPADLIDLFNRFRRSDLQLGGIVQTRLLALSEPDWMITSAAALPNSDVADVDRQRADDAAKYVRDQLRNKVKGFSGWLEEMGDAIFFGVRLAELYWEVTPSGHLLTEVRTLLPKAPFGDSDKPWEIRVPTTETDTQGVPIKQFPDKFVVHRPSAPGNSPWAGLMVGSTMLAAVKHCGLGWFATFAERWGTPYGVAKYKPGAPPTDIAAIEAALTAFAYNAFAIVPENSNVDFIDRGKSGDSLPQVALMEKCDRYQAIGILGQELTTQTSPSGGGAYELGKIHDAIRKSIRDADMAAKARTINEQIIRPMIQNSIYRGSPLPVFQQIVPEAGDREKEARILSTMVNDLGMPITLGQAASRLQFELTKDQNSDDLLPGRAVQPGGFGPNPFGGNTADPFSSPFSFTPALNLSAAAATLGLRTPDKARAPHSILDGWVEQAIRKVRSQTTAILATIRASIDLGGDRGRQLTLADAQDFARKLNAIAEDLPTTDLERATHSFLVASMLAGYQNGKAITTRTASRRTSIAAEPSGGLADFSAPFEEAVDAIRRRVALPADVFLDLDRAARNRAGRVAGMYDARLVELVYEHLNRLIAEGGTVSDFREALRGDGETFAGWLGSNPSHVALVFRQNATMAFATGHHRQMKSVNVGAYRWRSYQDSCPICRPYVGKIFLIDSTSPYPGGTHFGCDCWPEPTFGDEAASAVDIKSIANPLYAESQAARNALSFDPAEFGSVEPFDSSAIDPAIRPAFDRLIKR